MICFDSLFFGKSIQLFSCRNSCEKGTISGITSFWLKNLGVLHEMSQLRTISGKKGILALITGSVSVSSESVIATESPRATYEKRKRRTSYHTLWSVSQYTLLSSTKYFCRASSHWHAAHAKHYKRHTKCVRTALQLLADAPFPIVTPIWGISLRKQTVVTQKLDCKWLLPGLLYFGTALYILCAFYDSIKVTQNVNISWKFLMCRHMFIRACDI